MMLGMFCVSSRCDGVWFHLGYCHGFDVSDGAFHLIAPFTRAVFHSSLGPVPCVGTWTRSYDLSLEGHSLDFTRHEPWMDIRYEDIASLSSYFDSLKLSLPRRGFRRRNME